MAGNDRFGGNAYSGRRKASGGGSSNSNVIEITSTIEDLAVQIEDGRRKVAQQIAAYGKAVAEGGISANPTRMNDQINKFLDVAGLRSDAERAMILRTAFVLLAQNMM